MKENVLTRNATQRAQLYMSPLALGKQLALGSPDQARDADGKFASGGGGGGGASHAVGTKVKVMVNGVEHQGKVEFTGDRLGVRVKGGALHSFDPKDVHLIENNKADRVKAKAVVTGGSAEGRAMHAAITGGKAPAVKPIAVHPDKAYSRGPSNETRKVLESAGVPIQEHSGHSAEKVPVQTDGQSPGQIIKALKSDGWSHVASLESMHDAGTGWKTGKQHLLVKDSRPGKVVAVSTTTSGGQMVTLGKLKIKL